MTHAAPALRFALQLRVLIGPAIELGEVGGRQERVIPILGGSFAGPGIAGIVCPGGADWQKSAAGVADIHARYDLRADDGTPIAVDNAGIRRGAPDVLARLIAGETVDPALYYFRTAPRFTAPEGPHRWLSESLFVATGTRFADHVLMDVFAVE